MSARVITAIAFKVFALYFFVQVVMQIPSIWSIYGTLGPGESSETMMAFSPYLAAGAFTFIGFLMVFVIYALGSSVLKDIPDTAPSSEATKLEAVLFQLLGVYFVVTSLTYLPHNIIISSFGNMYEPGSPSLIALRFTTAIIIIKLVFGMALIVKAPAWQAFFYRLRTIGTQTDKKTSQSDV